VSVRVVLSANMSMEYTGGEKEFRIEARTLQGVIKAMEERFPGFGEILEEETTVAIDGEIHEPTFQPLRDGCELFFLPKIEAG
jgi:molybdopterin converting factor small subunit